MAGKAGCSEVGAAQRAERQLGSARRVSRIKIIMGYVYLLQSIKDTNHYIGSTPDLELRVKMHNQGKVQSTKYRRPLILIGYRETETLGEARILEHKYKKSHGALERDVKNGLFKMIKT